MLKLPYCCGHLRVYILINVDIEFPYKINTFSSSTYLWMQV